MRGNRTLLLAVIGAACFALLAGFAVWYVVGADSRSAGADRPPAIDSQANREAPSVQAQGTAGESGQSGQGGNGSSGEGAPNGASGAPKVASDERSRTTFAAKEPDRQPAATADPFKPFRFVVMGDSRGASDAISDAILKKLLGRVKALEVQPQFLLFTGDMIKGGSVEIELKQWKEIVDDYYPIHLVYPAIGNHEWDEKTFSRMFPHLPDGQLKGYGRTVYSFDYNGVRFVTLNSIRMDANKRYIVDSAQRDWLNEQLRTAAGKRYAFVQFHIPAYPGSSHYGKSLDANPAERDALWSVLDQNRITAAFVGHEHNYARRKVDASLGGSGHPFGGAVWQLTVGGAGAPLYTSVKDKRNVVVGPKANYHYMVVDVKEDEAVFQVFDIENQKLDSFAVKARNR